MRKTPAAGDYRVQTIHGGYERYADASVEDREAACRVVQSLDETPLYARVDMVRERERGTLLVMELELIEPYLYLTECPSAAPSMVRAIIRRLAQGSSRTR